MRGADEVVTDGPGVTLATLAVRVVPGVRRDAGRRAGCYRRGMGLGFGLLSAQLRPGETDWTRAYDDTVRLAVEAERVVQRREDDAGAELDRGCRLRERRADDEEGRHVAVIHKVMLSGPDRREAEPFRIDSQADRLVIGTRPIGLARSKLCAEESEAESHGHRR